MTKKPSEESGLLFVAAANSKASKVKLLPAACRCIVTSQGVAEHQHSNLK